MRLSNLLSGCEYRSTANAEKIEITGISERIEKIKAGDLFIARKSALFNPLLLIQSIEKSEARAILTEEDEEMPPTALPCFFVKDIARVRSLLWSRFHGSPEKEMTLIGITGTNGKTTTAHILTHILNSAGKRTGYIGTLGVLDGTEELTEYHEGSMTTPSPETLFGALAALKARGVTHAVLEVSSHALMQERTYPILFDLAIFTNLGEDHLDYHKTAEAYFSAKARLFRQTKRALINIDDAYGERLFKDISCEKYSYGMIYGGNFRASALHESMRTGTQYICDTPFASFEASYPLFGVFNAYNALAAISAALLLNLCPHEISLALATLPPIKGRMELLNLSEFGVGFSVIIDYAHTPEAMEQALKAVRKITRGNLYVLFGAGGDREKEKRAKMGHIAEKLADHAFITADNSRSEGLKDILKDIVSGISDMSRRTVIADRGHAIERALSLLKTGDTLLLLGKGHEEYIIDKNGKHPFSERETVYTYLGTRYGV